MKRLLLLFILLLFAGSLHAQEALPQETALQAALDLSVYVTTQDFSNLRRGPNTTFERYMIVPPAMTVPAIGRTADAQWVQVIYEGQRGWIAATLLVWSGPFEELTIDGVEPDPFVRRTTIAAVTSRWRTTPIYVDAVDPANYVGELPPSTPIEIVARLGDTSFRQYQILYEGQTYWVGSWNVTVERYANPNNALNTSYRFPYGRLLTAIGNTISTDNSRLNQIHQIWSTLNNGGSVSCNNVPGLLGQLDIPPTDLNQEPEFAPMTTALESAYLGVNTAITLFDDACNREDVFITQDDIDTAFAELSNAQRNLNVAQSLLSSLRTRDPFAEDR